MTIFAHIISTEYSLSEGYGKVSDYIKELKKQVTESGEENPALIIADKFSMSAHIPFYKDCVKSNIKPVFGMKVTIQGNDTTPDHDLILVAKGDEGRQNINKIATLAHITSNDKKYKTITREQLEENSSDLICLSGGYKSGLVERAIIDGDSNKALALTKYLDKIFKGEFYLNAQRTSNDQNIQDIENKVINGFEEIKNKLNTNIVATNDVRFPKKESYELHLTRQAIIDGTLIYNPSKNVTESPTQYLLPTAHMAYLFKDHPEYLLNAGQVVDKTSTEYYKDLLGKPFLPEFPIPEGFDNDPEKYLSHLTYEYFEKRWSKIEEDYKSRKGEIAYQNFVITDEFIKDERAKYEERLQFELEVIKKTKFAGYFLIVHDLIDWSRKNDIPVGPGRGSGAGSLVLYSLTITDIDPIPFDLLFERFLNPERMSEPDIDMDFSPENRGRVIQHLKDMYGKEKTAQILTEGTMAAKSVVDSIARTKGFLPYERDRLKGLVSEDLGTTIAGELGLKEGAIPNDKLIEAYNSNPAYKKVLDMALELEGQIISYGKHAGGVVISLGKMEKFAALYQDAVEQEPVVQLNKNTCEYAGLIKFDVLGLKNLDIIHNAITDINEDRPDNEKLNISTISLKDPKTLDLFKRADTYGIFQFESGGMRNLMQRMSPDKFDEIVALVALFRPGPLQSKMDEDFINRKFSTDPIKYLHPKVEKLLSTTFGTIIYQEQVMNISRELAGFTPGGADILRKAMGKKIQSIMDEERVKFCSGCVDATAREETLANTQKNLGMGIDIVFENTENNFMKELTKDSNNKITTYDHIASILSHYAGYSKQQIDDLKKDINDVKLDDLKFGYFYKFHANEILKGARIKLKEDGVSEANIEKEAQRVAIASSVFVRYNGIFSLMDKFAAYGFNKSHSVAYARVSFETAYLKAHYPAQYMSAMATKQADIEKLTLNLTEIRRMGLNILPPDVNESNVAFKALSNQSTEDHIRYGLGQIKGITKSVEHLVKLREQNGPAKDIFDFYNKYGTYVIKEDKEQSDGTIKTSKKTLMSKTVLSNLINAGALDSLCPDKNPVYRPMLHSTYMYLEDVIKDVKKRLKANNADIVKKLKIHYGKEYLNVMKTVTGLDDPESFMVPDNVVTLDNDKLKGFYDKFADMIDSRANKKTEMSSIKSVESFNKEIELFNPDIKTKEFNGQLYIIPDSKTFNDVPEYGTKEQISKEFSLTGMYQSSSPMNQVEVLLAKMALQFNPIPNDELNYFIKKEGNLRGKNQIKYADVNVAGIVTAVDYKRNTNKDGEVYTNVRVRLDDGNETVTVQFKAEEMFTSGKEQRGIDMLEGMIGKDVLFASGSSKEPQYDSAEVVVYSNRIGSTNQSVYLPAEDPSLNYKEDLHERAKKGLATDNQIDEIKSLLKKSNLAIDDFIKEHKLKTINDFTKMSASQILVDLKQKEEQKIKLNKLKM